MQFTGDPFHSLRRSQMFRNAITASALGLLFGATSSFAATIIVNSGESIQTAINGASNGDTILVNPGTYTGSLDTNDKTLIIKSSGGPLVTTINGNNAGPCISIDDTNGSNNPTTIEGFTLTNGRGVANGLGGFYGGGAYCWLTAPTIRNCIIRNNAVSGTGSRGGGVYCFFAQPRLINCLIYDNTSSVSGGGVYAENNSAPYMVNCTIADNTANTGGGIFNNNSAPRLISCIVYSNNDDAIAPVGSAIVTHSNIQGGHSGLGNINLNPQFVSVGSNNFRLLANSPCIDAGDSMAIADELSKDIDLNPRGVDDPNTVDTGVQVFGLVVDMGSFEFQVPCEGGPSSCEGDLTNGAGTGPDGVVNVSDLFRLLANWGACPP